MSRVLCFDIGGTFVKYGLIQEGKMISSDKFPTDRSDGQTVLASMKEIIQKTSPAGWMEFPSARLVLPIINLEKSSAEMSSKDLMGWILEKPLKKNSD